jgi:hypothetical protein
MTDKMFLVVRRRPSLGIARVKELPLRPHSFWPQLARQAAGRQRAMFAGVAGLPVEMLNGFRLVCAVHFNTGMVFALRLLPHAEYSKNTWKNEL